LRRGKIKAVKMTSPTKQIIKKDLAKKLGISRSSLYYQAKLPDRDDEVRHQIESVLVTNPEYGHKRIALALKLKLFTRQCIITTMSESTRL